ncbi:aspartate kinase [Zavarzinella formosa]|uniref:aspartate kinase n=1 Tax=Zavarzinella formosa TaxID=360055 RepID=UPI0002D6D5A0|nr:aspartate kinase [Zavarzinella formosa]
MSVVVQKFGGSSVANAERIMRAARRAIRAKQAGNQVVVVVSARGDTTDDLIELAQEISENPPAREMDMLLATGEQISIALMAMAIQELGEQALSFTGVQVGIRTDSTHTKARIKEISTARMREALDAGNIIIVAGFQGVDEKQNITTLGRGGSDTTAVALAAALKLSGIEKVACEIYTDVDGVYTTDPRIVPEARKMDKISYDEMLELASMGAGVMHSRSIEFAKKYDVPLMVRSSFSDAEGTWIMPEAAWMTGFPVCGAALAKDEVRVFLENVPDRPGVSHQVFAAIAAKNIAVDMIAQSVGRDGKACIGFTVMRNDLNLTIATLQPITTELGGSIAPVEDVCKVSVVGSGMRTRTGVAEKMFAALTTEGVNMKMITTGDIKISVLVDKADGVRALKAVHHSFALEKARPGAGEETVGSLEYQTKTIIRQDAAGDLAQAISRLAGMEDIVISGVKLDTNYGRVTSFDLPDQPGNCSRVFQTVATGHILVDMIVQNLTGPGRAELSFTAPKTDLTRALKRTQDVVREIDPNARVAGESDIAILYVTGVGMRTHTGVARTMFGALASRGINIAMINSSEVCVSVVVDADRGEEALECLREAFKLT